VEGGAEAVAVKVNACGKVVGHAGVERAVFSVGEGVDVEHGGSERWRAYLPTGLVDGIRRSPAFSSVART
jgi:hypothetical protein